MIRTMTGEIVSTKTPHMVVVSVVRIWRHPVYKKAVRKAKRFAAHNDTLELVVGDRVVIAETKPMSKTIHFKVVSKL
ncbi:30S ribosomal protein S17 [Candidatus Gottesmanbacteria bacterium RIFCSPHIGHO2_01_FULL_46_14]|uniref:30S ribosomal protein S17 n=3 Tax=Candidatus Gottesmaniibacteriota TaxID=1752720 RepID=A0A1F5ZRW7_9BACT|nr:MAG: 30S ribosomal protein S17 [Candidatus Gottesmanbacteria bacterium RIFCSPHIGHO2_01_FULL_46_14]OGG28659.1 MAG: 30S ribosomal protein S17 [Candidatus Gottesmanbacteria bacterium RIFCSPLOWO2_01_FULL_46_21]